MTLIKTIFLDKIKDAVFQKMDHQLAIFIVILHIDFNDILKIEKNTI